MVPECGAWRSSQAARRKQRELTAEASGDVPRTFRAPGGSTEKTQEYCGQLPRGRGQLPPGKSVTHSKRAQRKTT
eukprot:10927341-Alexandrium_andersonii.AAC.1